MSHVCLKPYCPATCCGCNHAVSMKTAIAFAARYQWLRERDLDTIADGGIFAGKTPDNLILNGNDLDAAIDGAMKIPTNEERDAAMATWSEQMTAIPSTERS